MREVHFSHLTNSIFHRRRTRVGPDPGAKLKELSGLWWGCGHLRGGLVEDATDDLVLVVATDDRVVLGELRVLAAERHPVREERWARFLGRHRERQVCLGQPRIWVSYCDPILRLKYSFVFIIFETVKKPAVIRFWRKKKGGSPG